MNSTPPMRRVDQLAGLDRGRAEVLADQVGPVRLDHLGPDQQPVRGEDAAEDAGHRGLAGARRAGEDEVPCRRLAGQPLPICAAWPPAAGAAIARTWLLDRVQADQLSRARPARLQRGRVRVAAQPAGELGERPAPGRPRAMRDAGPARAGSSCWPDHPHVAGLARLLRAGCGRTGRCPGRRRSGGGRPPRTCGTAPARASSSSRSPRRSIAAWASAISSFGE